MDRLSSVERGQLDAVVQVVRGVLGDAAVGTYLFGSAVDSGLRRDSDLDILVVSSRRTTDVERRALIDGLLRTSRGVGDEAGKRHLEVTVVARPEVQPWHYPPAMELQYGEWWRREFESGDGEPWISPNPDLAVLLTAARANGVPLLGPPVDQLVSPVPRGDLRRALVDVIPDLMADLESDVRNVLLTLARIWFTLETGAIESKDVASRWVLARLPEGYGEALRSAQAGYLGHAEDAWDDEAMALARADARAIRSAIEGTLSWDV